MRQQVEVTVRVISADNRKVIEVKGKCIVLSEIKSHLQGLLNDSAIDEVRIYAATNLSVDANLSRDVWHGRNLVVLANEINVCTTVTWDVSGKDSDHAYTSNAGTGANGLGKDGCDGYAGESGGNVFVQANTIQNLERLTIISNGGTGSGGQDGGNGKDGVDGKGISKKSFKEYFPHCLKLRRGTRIDLVKKIVQTIYAIAECVQIEWMKKKSFGYDRGPYVTSNLLEHLKDDKCFDIYLHVVTKEGNEIFFSLWDAPVKCDSFLVYKGSPGQRGKSGGSCGMGGQGGFPGEIAVMGLNDGSIFSICSQRNWGNDGKNGQGGFDGRDGKNGWDMGFFGEVGLFEATKTIYGADQNSKLKLLFSLKKASGNIYHPYMAKHTDCNKYVRIDEATIDQSSTVSKRNNAVARNERQNHSKAVRKNSITATEILATFFEYLNEIERQQLERQYLEWQEPERQKLEMQRSEKNERTLLIEKQRQEKEPEKKMLEVQKQQFEKSRPISVRQSVKVENQRPNKGWEISEKPPNEQEKMVTPRKDIVNQSAEGNRITNLAIKRHLIFSQDTIDQYRFEFVKLTDKFSNFEKLYQGNSNDEKFPFLEHNFILDDWLKLRSQIVNFAQLERLVKCFEALKPTFDHLIQKKNNTKLKILEETLTIKYKFSILNKIAEKLPIYAKVNRILTTNKNVTRYLDETCQQNELIKHAVLGSLKQYIFENSREQRSKLVQYVTKSLNSSDNAWKCAIKTYVMRTDAKKNDNDGLKKFYDEYHTFIMQQRQTIDYKANELVEKLIKSKNKEALQLWNDCVDDPTLLQDLKVKLRQDNTLSLLCDEIEAEEKRKYNWDRCCADEQVQEIFKIHLEQEGITSESYRILLAYVYNVNLRVYRRDDYNEIVLLEDHNPQSTTAEHILLKANEFIQLKVNDAYCQLEGERLYKDKIYRRILTEISALQDVKDFKCYFIRELFNKNSSSNDEATVELREASTIEKIAALFPDEERELISQRLKSISAQYTGQERVFESLLERFCFEGRHVSFNELCFLINSILSHTVEARQEKYSFSWIISANEQHTWTDELVLLQLENHFKKQLKNKIKWRTCMSNIHNKGVLLVFAAQFARNPCTEECVEDILHLVSNIPIESVCLDRLDLTEWSYVLKEYYWTERLQSLTAWKELDSLTSATYYILSIENNHGKVKLEKLFEILKGKQDELTASWLNETMKRVHNQKWFLNDGDLDILQEKSLTAWEKHMNATYKISSEELNVPQIVTIVIGNANTSRAIKDQVFKIQALEENMKQNQTCIQDKITSVLEKDNIKQWTKAFRKTKSKHGIDIYEQMIAVIDRAIQLKRGFRLRGTQRLTILALLANKNKTLAQVSTGEGKSLIVVATAIIKGLLGETVDIITSSSVLAQRDANDNQDIYELFGLSAFHNCSEDMEERKDIYSCNQIMYGDLANFQRDYLLDRFYGERVLGDRSFENVIVDEVDSMLLDKGNNMLYLSHDIAGMDKLESVYVFIWQKVNKLSGLTEAKVVETIKRSVLSDMYPSIQKTDIESLDKAMGNSTILSLWERLVKSGIMSECGRLLTEKIDSIKLRKAVSPDFIQYEDRLNFLLSSRIERNTYLKVPKYLKPFVERHLESWISSALTALYMVPGQYYVVDVDRSGTSADRHANVIVIDRDTGTDQVSAQWDEALHQFLQLKHGCKLSAQNLKAVFISNVTYLKMYKLLYGLTGTLGSQRERNLLEEIHQVDFVTIPTAKPKQFDEYEPIICSSKEKWGKCIRKEIEQLTNVDKRSVLIICATINDVESLVRMFLTTERTNVHIYKRDYEKFAIDEGGLQTGQIIIATNLAGRGTDIKISNELRDAGGLHVILTFLPANIRIEEQAYGRAARKGEKGSGRMITMVADDKKQLSSTIFTLKKQRNVDELFRLSTMKSYYETTIQMEEKCFQAFNDLYCEKMKCLAKAGTPDPVKEILLQSCLDKWSFWLDEHNALIGRSSDVATKRQVKQHLNQLVAQYKDLKATDAIRWVAWVEGNPMQMVKLAKYIAQHKSKHYDTALQLFDEVINNEPDFCEAACYYRAYTRLLGDMNFGEFKTDLRMAERLFEKHIKSTLHASGIVGILKSRTIHFEGYKEQKKNLIHLFSLFIQSIDDILGHSITPDAFVNDEINADVAGKIFEDLVQMGMIQMVNSNALDTQLKQLPIEYGIFVDKLKEFLASHILTNDGKKIMREIRKSFSFPSRSEFWKKLVKHNVLHSVEEYVAINEERLEMKKREVMSIIKEKIENGELVKEAVKLEKNQILLIHEDYSKAYFEKEKLIGVIGKDNFSTFTKKGLLSFNEKATIDKSKMADGVFSKFDSITAEDIVNRTGITTTEAYVIIDELLRQKVLEKRGNAFALNVNHDQDILLPTYPVYENMIRSVLASCFAYRLALRNIALQLEDEDCFIIRTQLASDPHRLLFNDLLGHAIIQPPCLNLAFDMKTAVKMVCKNRGFSINSIAASHIKLVLERSKSMLKALKKNKVNLKSIEEIFEKVNFGTIDEMRMFMTNGLEHLLVPAEKNWTMTVMLNIFAVTSIGLVEIGIGAIIKACSAGILELEFINEGIKDILYAVDAGTSGHFSWEDYIQQKKSIACTILNQITDEFLSDEAKTGLKQFGPVLKNIYKSKSKGMDEISKKKAIELKKEIGYSFIVVNRALDKIIAEHLQTNLNALISDVLSRVRDEVASHKVSKSLQKAYYTLGESDTKALVDDLSKKYMVEQMVSKIFLHTVKQIFLAVKNGMRNASEVTDTIGSDFINRLNMIVSIDKSTVQISNMRTATNELLNSVNTELERRLDDVKQSSTTSRNNLADETDSECLLRKVIRQWQIQLSEHVGKLLRQHVVEPAITLGVSSIASYSGRVLKHIQQSREDSMNSENTNGSQNKPEQKTDRPDMMDETKRHLTDDYHGQLLKVMHKKRSKGLLATIIRENFPMDLKCVGACAPVIHKWLATQTQTEITGLTITVHGNKGMKQSFSSGTGGPEIHLMLRDNHFTVSPVDGSTIDTSANYCLQGALATAFTDVQSVRQNAFRFTLSDYIENNKCIPYNKT